MALVSKCQARSADRAGAIAAATTIVAAPNANMSFFIGNLPTS
jgi:hypothetical protein